MALKYLFHVDFTDGSSFTQSPEDTSQTFPGRSSFTDLLHLVSGGCTVKSFTLQGEDGSVAVDLEDGHFEINGAPVWLGDEIPPPGSEFKLIYFRQVQIHFNADTREEVGGSVRFCIGWESDVDGRKLKAILGVF